MFKHYIRVDGIFIVKTFSTAFEHPQAGDICVNENGDRHFNLDLYRDDGLPNLKYINSEILQTTDADLADQIAELENVPMVPTIEEIVEEVDTLALVLLDLMGV